MTSFQFKQYFQNLTKKEKSYWNLKHSWKQELDSYEIDQFQSILSSGRTYPLKIPHGRMRILYRSIQNYSSIEDNTFLKERGMLGPYNTSDYPITIVFASLINIVVPLLSPYSYFVPNRIPLLLFLWLYIIIVRSAGLYCDSLDSYI